MEKYIKPACEIVNVNVESAILAGSVIDESGKVHDGLGNPDEFYAPAEPTETSTGNPASKGGIWDDDFNDAQAY